jgi:hypothetical protein
MGDNNRVRPHVSSPNTLNGSRLNLLRYGGEGGGVHTKNCKMNSSLLCIDIIQLRQ